MVVKDPRRTPTSEKGRAIVDAIVDATEQLLANQAPEDVTPTSVARRAGVSMGSVYQYFPGMNAILAAWQERYLRRGVATLEDASATCDATTALQIVFDAAARSPARGAAAFATHARPDVVEECVRRATESLAYVLLRDATPSIVDLDAGTRLVVMARVRWVVRVVTIMGLDAQVTLDTGADVLLEAFAFAVQQRLLDTARLAATSAPACDQAKQSDAA